MNASGKSRNKANGPGSSASTSNPVLGSASGADESSSATVPKTATDLSIDEQSQEGNSSDASQNHSSIGDHQLDDEEEENSFSVGDLDPDIRETLSDSYPQITRDRWSLVLKTPGLGVEMVNALAEAASAGYASFCEKDDELIEMTEKAGQLSQELSIAKSIISKECMWSEDHVTTNISKQLEISKLFEVKAGPSPEGPQPTSVTAL